MCFCGFILIFDSMSISQLEIDKSVRAAKSELGHNFGVVQRCKVSQARGQSTSVSHFQRAQRAFGTNYTLLIVMYITAYLPSTVVQAAQTLVLQSLQAQAGSPASL